MSDPGATTSIRLPQLEKSDRKSHLVDEPTVTALEIQPGAPTAES